MSNGVPTGTRATLSRYNFRRICQRAIDRAGDDLVERHPHGPHDLRHTFSTWLEDAGIPHRVIDELMGHERSAMPRSTAGIALAPATGTPRRRWPSGS